jgi:ribosomal protein S18 acetylase RimI-like enzyme
MTAADLPFVETLHVVTLGAHVGTAFGWGEAQARERFAMDIRGDLARAACEILMVGGRDVGYLAVEDQATALFVDAIALVPEHQGRGVGTQLLREVMARGAAAGVPVRLNVLRVNPARALYERLGFRIIGGDSHRHYMEWRG